MGLFTLAKRRTVYISKPYAQYPGTMVTTPSGLSQERCTISQLIGAGLHLGNSLSVSLDTGGGTNQRVAAWRPITDYIDMVGGVLLRSAGPGPSGRLGQYIVAQNSDQRKIRPRKGDA